MRLEARAGHDEAVPRFVGEVLGALADPVDVRLVASRPGAANLDHGHRLVHRIDPVHELGQGPRHIASPAPDVEHDPWLVMYQTVEYLEDLVRVRRIVDVGAGYAPVFELVGVFRAEMPGLWDGQRMPLVECTRGPVGGSGALVVIVCTRRC